LGAYYFPRSASDDSITTNLPGRTEPEDLTTAKFVASVSRIKEKNSTNYTDNFNIDIAPLDSNSHSYQITIKDKTNNVTL